MIFHLFLLLTFSPSFASESNKREVKYDSDGFEIIASDPSAQLLEAINDEYLARVRPIFVRKCLMCHGELSEHPWYYRIPGIKQLMDSDMRRAKGEMNMAHDFPFEGHGSALDDLRSLEREIQQEEMPPVQYRLVHWNSLLTPEEVDQVMKWIATSREKLESSP